MFYYSINSKEKIVHYEGCYHLKNIQPNNLKSFDTVRDVRKSRYRICSCCSPITARLKKEQAELERYCLENGLLYYVNKGDLHIRTYHSKWKILVCDSKSTLELHHKNLFKKEYEDSTPGYHRQNFCSDSILGYLKYIDAHESYRKLNPLNIVTKKEPPKKGTRRYRGLQKALAKKERKRQIGNVLNLIDSLSVGAVCGAQA